jgi:hypothetical protein
MKTIAFALVALIAGSAVAAPVLAADSLGFDASFYQTQLRYDGINAIDVDDYSNNRLRVLVQLDNGNQVVQFFDKDSFQLVTNG